MAARINARELIIDFVNGNKNVPQLQFIVDDPHGVEISDTPEKGSVNYIYRVRSADKRHSVIIKYGEETIRAWPEEKISLDRQLLEYNCLELMHSLIPGSVPRPYCLDIGRNIIAMEDMSSWDLLGDQLEMGQVDISAAENLGRVMGNMHILTAKKNMNPERWQEFIEKYRAEDVRNTTLGYFVERPFVETDTINCIPKDLLHDYRRYVEDVKGSGRLSKIVELFLTEECLTHADLHWFAVFVQNGNVVMFDWELCFLSHSSQNLALPITSYYICYIRHKTIHDTGSDDILQKCQMAVSTMLEAYLKARPDLCVDPSLQGKFFSDVALCLGCMVFAMSISNPDACIYTMLDQMRPPLFHLGQRIMMSYESMTSIEKFSEAIKEV